MKLYIEEIADELFKSRKAEIIKRILSETESYILNVGDAQYIQHLKESYLLDFPILKTNEAYIDTYETEVRADRFPSEFFMRDKTKYFKKDVIVYHIPFEGNINLLKFRPNSWSSHAGYEVEIEAHSSTIKLEFINFFNDPAKIKQAYENSLIYVFACYNELKNNVENYNNSLEQFISSTLNARRQEILNKKDFLSALGVPIRKKNDVSDTYAVPKPKLKEKITIKPVVYETGFKPEPTLDNDNYNKILKLINDVGKNFERMPSVYTKKEEEDLRDHILMTLDPNFEFGSASGETFNKTGKTDIQLRYDSSVIFIAECKFWGGEKKFLDTIDQLLKYLTWRDSKTSVIIFARNKEITPVLTTVEKSVIKHPSFIKELHKSDESWFNYIFSLPGDKNKEIKLAVQVFHIP